MRKGLDFVPFPFYNTFKGESRDNLALCYNNIAVLVVDMEEKATWSSHVLTEDAAPTGRKVYERHDMSRFPVIFHCDTVDGGCNTSNFHENVEILLFIEGSGRVFFEGVPTAYEAGDICVIDSGVLHRVESDSHCRYFCLIVDGEFCERQGLAHEDVRFVKRIRDAALTEKYNKIAEAFYSSDDYRVPAVKGAVLSFMVHLLRAHAEEGKGRAVRENETIRTVIRHIRAHYAETLTVDALASLAGLSKFHFLREFKRVTGQTAVTYINNLRIERATRMLDAGGTTVAAVAAACGFASHAYFSKTFYRLRGVHPSSLLSGEKR